jgi:polysaccharide export outer membrane protein
VAPVKNLISSSKSWIFLAKLFYLLPLLAVIVTITGCQTNETGANFPQTGGQPAWPGSGSTNQSQSGTETLRAGDTLKISFPGAPTLNTTQQIRTDGKIALDLIGEVTAAGKTPEDLQSDLLKLYAPQLTTKQIVVTVVSSTIQFYVIGAVLRSGPVTVDHPISVLDAIMEAGGFDETKANLKAVVVIRQENGQTVRKVIDLKKAFEGKEEAPLMQIKPDDIVFVPERFTWF